MEAFEDRLKRFLTGSPDEIFFTILNSIANFSRPELRTAVDQQLYSLAILGTHAGMQTIAEQIYGESGLAATQFYLNTFVDRPGDTVKFGDIAQELHGYRNVKAHRWSAKSSHNIILDLTVIEGWRRDTDGLHVNPVVFIDRFLDGFRAGSPMWELPRSLPPLARLQRKYRYLRQWLELTSGDSLHSECRQIEDAPSLAAAQALEAPLQQGIATRYGVTLT